MNDREVREYLLHHYVEYVRTHRREGRTTTPFSLGDWVTVTFSNPLTVQLRELEAVGGAAGRAGRFLDPASPEQGDTEVLLEGLGNPSILVVGNPVDGVRFYGPFTHPEDADSFAEAELRHQEWWSVELHRAEREPIGWDEG